MEPGVTGNSDDVFGAIRCRSRATTCGGGQSGPSGQVPIGTGLGLDDQLLAGLIDALVVSHFFAYAAGPTRLLNLRPSNRMVAHRHLGG